MTLNSMLENSTFQAGPGALPRPNTDLDGLSIPQNLHTRDEIGIKSSQQRVNGVQRGVPPLNIYNQNQDSSAFEPVSDPHQVGVFAFILSKLLR